MKLVKALLENFRSIVNSNECVLESRVTVIVGKNEQGKTNLLKGLASFNRDYIYNQSDLPTHLLPTLENILPAQIRIVTLWFSIEPEDNEELNSLLQEFENAKGVKVSKFFDGHYEFQVVASDDSEQSLHFGPPKIEEPVNELKGELVALQQRIANHGARYAGFAPSVPRAEQLISDLSNANFADRTALDNLIDTFMAGLKSLPSQDQPVQADFEGVQKKLLAVKARIAEALAADREDSLWSHLPIFVLHEAGKDRIPNEVTVAAFIIDPAKNSPGMANLCKSAGLSMQKIQEISVSADTSKRSSYEHYFTTKVSGAINEFWRQAEYTLNFRFGDGRLAVSIADNDYSAPIATSERSDGFQWYLSFYSALTAEAASAQTRILLLDNPGLELHGDGQADIRRFLEEKQSANTQVVYVTHSPAMVDTFRLEQVRKVERFDNYVGTKVNKLTFGDGPDADLLEPVRTAIGSSLVNSLMFNSFNILVEGAADKPILEAALVLGESHDRLITVNGSIAHTKAFLPRFYERAALPYVVFHDHDDGGRELARVLTSAGVPQAKIVSADKAFEGSVSRDIELEDLLSEGFYHQAVCAAYPDKEIPLQSTSASKRTKQYAEFFRTTFSIGFSKTRVAEKVKDLAATGHIDDESRQALLRVRAALLAVLESQAGRQ